MGHDKKSRREIDTEKIRHEEDSETIVDPETEKGEQDTNVSHEFQEIVLMYLKYDDMLKQLAQQAKEIRLKKKDCENKIIKYLKREDEQEILVDDGKLQMNETESKGTIKPELVEAILLHKLKNVNEVSMILKLIEINRETKKRVAIKRVCNKKPTKKLGKRDLIFDLMDGK